VFWCDQRRLQVQWQSGPFITESCVQEPAIPQRKGFSFAGKGTLAGLTDAAGLIKIQLWFAEAASRENAMRASRAALECESRWIEGRSQGPRWPLRPRPLQLGACSADVCTRGAAYRGSNGRDLAIPGRGAPAAAGGSISP
jgi:hypothetical protein